MGSMPITLYISKGATYSAERLSRIRTSRPPSESVRQSSALAPPVTRAAHPPMGPAPRHYPAG